MRKAIIVGLACAFLFPAAVMAKGKNSMGGEPIGAFGIHGSVGIDSVWGLPGFGGGISYLLFGANKTALEFQGGGYLNNGTVDYDASDVPFEGPSYDTNITIGTIQVNGLFNYDPQEGGIFFLAGAGFAFGSRSWSDGPPSPESYDYSSAGSLVDFGLGYLSPSGFEARLEVPLYYFYDSLYYSGEATFIATVTASIGYRFLN